MTRGIPTNGTQELIGATYRLDDPTAILLRNSARRQRWGYLGAEIAWYLEGSNSLEDIKAYAPSYEKFSDDGLTLYGAYGMRGLSLASLVSLAAQIRESRESRQYVIPIWRLNDRVAKTKDMPCTVALHFLLRGDLLYLSTFMRSNDLGTGFIYDVPCFCLMQQLVASSLGVGLGYYTHMVGSLHIYDRDREKLERALATPTTYHRWTDFNYQDANWLRSEFRHMRVGVPSNPATRAVVSDMGELYDYHRGSGLRRQDDTSEATVDPSTNCLLYTSDAADE